ncbi:glycosyltransferase 87 family protein [Kribbella sp. NPDC051770]|uniref:glycosyltransferase 87 family protein n=1 Tax=Kribbella sp. NPDC051770 TaxID=3155413 RepID=UPI00343F55F1
MRGNWRWAAALVVGVAACIVLPLLWRHAMVDLKVYRLGGETLLEHPKALYDVRLGGTPLPFTYPPFAAVVMVPFALMPWPVATVVWTVVTIVALVAVWRICITLPPAAMFGVVAASLLLEPVRETLGFGQVNLLLCALILYDVLNTKHNGRGIWIGVAAGIKLTPLVFLGLLAVTRQWKALAYATAGFAATVLVGFAVTPKAATEYWTSLVSDATRVGGLAFASNQSWNGFLVRVQGDLDGGGPIWLALAALTALAGLYFCRVLWLRGDRIAATAVTGLISLLCSPVSWSHHWVWCIPLGVALVQPFETRAKVAVGILWTAVFAIAPIWWPPNHENRELDWTIGQQIAGNAYLIAATLAFALLVVRTVKSSRHAVTSSCQPV